MASLNFNPTSIALACTFTEIQHEVRQVQEKMSLLCVGNPGRDPKAEPEVIEDSITELFGRLLSIESDIQSDNERMYHTGLSGEIETLQETMRQIMENRLPVPSNRERPDPSDGEYKAEPPPRPAQRPAAPAAPHVQLLPRPPLRREGFPNLGASCYSNAVFHMLINTPELRDVLKRGGMSHYRNMPLLNLFQDFIATDPCTSAIRIRKTLNDWIKRDLAARAQFDGGQQSAREFCDEIFREVDFTGLQSPVLHSLTTLYNASGQPIPGDTGVFLGIRHNPHIYNPTFGDNLHNSLEAGRKLRSAPEILCFHYEKSIEHYPVYTLQSGDARLTYSALTFPTPDFPYILETGLPDDRIRQLANSQNNRNIFNRINQAIGRNPFFTLEAYFLSYQTHENNHLIVQAPDHFFLEINGANPSLITQEVFNQKRNELATNYITGEMPPYLSLMHSSQVGIGPRVFSPITMHCVKKDEYIESICTMFQSEDCMFEIPADLIQTGENPIYEITQAIVHGGQADRGHYIYIIKREGDGQWFLFNDSRVDKITPAEALECLNKGISFVARKVPANQPPNDGGPPGDGGGPN